MHSLFLARYCGTGNEFKNFPTNFSATKKASGFQACLRASGVRPVLLVTHAGDVHTRQTVIRKVDDFICIIPRTPRLFNIRFLVYFWGIIYSYFIIRKLRKRLDFAVYFSWDYLPDSLLPLLMQGNSIRSRLVVDVEESIIADPKAGSLFKKFEALISRHIPLRAIGNNEFSAQSLGVKLEGNFPGFYANSISEERKLVERISEKTYDHRTVVLFSGRIDSVRGADQFLELAELLQTERDISFVMTGFGSAEDIERIQAKITPNIQYNPGATREDYLKALFNTDIAFNYLADTDFASNSFPSKVVEYLLGAVTVISNHEVETSSNRVKTLETVQLMAGFINNYHQKQQEWRATYQLETVQNELAVYSVAKGAEEFKRIIQSSI